MPCLITYGEIAQMVERQTGVQIWCWAWVRIRPMLSYNYHKSQTNPGNYSSYYSTRFVPLRRLASRPGESSILYLARNSAKAAEPTDSPRVWATSRNPDSPEFAWNRSQPVLFFLYLLHFSIIDGVLPNVQQLTAIRLTLTACPKSQDLYLCSLDGC